MVFKDYKSNGTLTDHFFLFVSTTLTFREGELFYVHTYILFFAYPSVLHTCIGFHWPSRQSLIAYLDAYVNQMRSKIFCLGVAFSFVLLIKKYLYTRSNAVYIKCICKSDALKDFLSRSSFFFCSFEKEISIYRVSQKDRYGKKP